MHDSSINNHKDRIKVQDKDQVFTGKYGCSILLLNL